LAGIAVDSFLAAAAFSGCRLLSGLPLGPVAAHQGNPITLALAQQILRSARPTV